MNSDREARNRQKALGGPPNERALWKELIELKKAIRNKLKSTKGEKRIHLKDRIKFVKEKNPNSTQIEIARYTDFTVDDISVYFPSSWMKVRNAPRRLEDALKHKKLHNRVKSYISRA